MAPSLSRLLIHTPESPIQPGPGREEGSLELFCSGGFLREIVKAVTVWAFISPEKGRGRKDRGRGQEGDGGEHQRGVWTQTALLTGTPKEGEDERERKNAVKRPRKRENDSNRKPKKKNPTPELRHPVYFHPFSLPPLSLDSSLSLPSIWPDASSLLSSITSFCPPPHPSSPASHPPPLLYTHSIIGGDQAKRDVWGWSDHYHHLFPLHVSYGSPYRKQTFKS